MTDINQQIIQEALSKKPFAKLSPQAQQYRSTGALPSLTPEAPKTPQDESILPIQPLPQITPQVAPTGQTGGPTSVPTPQPQPIPQSTPTAQPQPVQQTGSIVDYLRSVGQPFDFKSRQQLAQQQGIQNYQGTAQQNTQLLNTLRQGQAQQPQPVPTVSPLPSTEDPNTKVIGDKGVTAPTDELGKELQIIETEFGKLASQFGLTPSDSSKNPVTAYTDYFKQAFDSLGLAEIKPKRDEALKNYESLNKEMTDRITDINENPWLDAEAKNNQTDRVRSRYDQRLAIAESHYNILSGQYEQGRSDAQHVADKAVEFSHQGQTLNKDLALKFLDIAEKEMAARRKLQTPFKLGAGQTEFQYNPLTGSYEAVTEVPPREAITSRARGRGIVATARGGAVGGNIDSLAQQMIAGQLAPSQLPGFGQNSLKARVIGRVSEIDPTFNFSEAEQQFAFGKANKTQLINFSIQSANNAVSIIRELSNKVKRSNITPINAALLQFRSKTGDVNTSKFLAAVKIVGDEYGAVFGLGAATDFKAQLGLSVVDPKVSNEQFNANLDTVLQLMQARQQALNLQAGKRPPSSESSIGTSGATSSGLNYQILP